jgi:hypothetical protein
MIKNFTNNLEATAYGYAMGVLSLTETDSQAEIRIVAVSAETDSRVKIHVSYYGGQEPDTIEKIDKYISNQVGGELIELKDWAFIDMNSIDLAVEAEKLSEFFEALKFDPDYDGTDDGDLS